MDVGVGNLFLAVGRHIYFRYNATFGDIVDNTTEQMDLENMGIAVGILSVGVLDLEITVEYFTPPPLLA